MGEQGGLGLSGGGRRNRLVEAESMNLCFEWF